MFYSSAGISRSLFIIPYIAQKVHKKLVKYRVELDRKRDICRHSNLELERFERLVEVLHFSLSLELLIFVAY